jgi:hypothetical protein
MAGHTSEKRWRRNQNPIFGNKGVSEQAQDLCTEMTTILTKARAAFLEMQELYQYVGSTVQGLADQLFYEDWTSRSATGVQAVLTVDVTAGAVSAVAITEAGTGYADGTGFTINLSATAGGGDATALISYDVVSGALTNAAVDVAGATYTDGAGQSVLEAPTPGLVFEAQASAEEVGKAQDLFDAVTALNELYLAADNGVTTTEDRFAQLRRMS